MKLTLSVKKIQGKSRAKWRIRVSVPCSMRRRSISAGETMKPLTLVVRILRGLKGRKGISGPSLKRGMKRASQAPTTDLLFELELDRLGLADVEILLTLREREMREGRRQREGSCAPGAGELHARPRAPSTRARGRR